MVKHCLLPAFILAALALCQLEPTPAHAQKKGAGGKGQGGVIIELDDDFIEKYAERATITSELRIDGISSVHKPEKDGEAHIGGWSFDVGLACVAEVMNAGDLGKPALGLFR